MSLEQDESSSHPTGKPVAGCASASGGLQRFAELLQLALRAEEQAAEWSNETTNIGTAGFPDDVDVSVEAFEEDLLKARSEDLRVLVRGLGRLASSRARQRRAMWEKLVAANAGAENAKTEASLPPHFEAETKSSKEIFPDIEGALAKLTAARKALKDKEWEMSSVKRKMEQAEEERLRQEGRIRSLETALERAASKKLEEMDRSDSVFKVLEEVMTKAARGQEKSEDLQQKLADAERSLKEAKCEALRSCSLERELSSAQARCEELELRLETSERRLRQQREQQEEQEQEQEQDQQRARVAASVAGNQETFVEAPTSKQDCPEASPEPLPAAPHPVSNQVSASSRPEASPVDSNPQPRPSRSSSTARSRQQPPSLLMPGAMLPGSTASKARRGGSTPAGARVRRPSSGAVAANSGGSEASSMPMDLLALGNLLTGGGLGGKKR